MGAADLHQLDKMRIGDLADEMHPAHIQSVLDLIEVDVFPLLPFRGRVAIADLVTADNHHFRVGPRHHHIRQGAHEAVIAAIGFQVTVDEGQHLVASLQHLAVAKGNFGLGIGLYDVGFHSVVDHLDHRLQQRRVGARLPLCRRQPGIGMQQGLRKICPARLRAEQLCEAIDLEFRVETDIATNATIVKLGIDQQLGFGPDFFQEQRLAPAGMAEDHIGIVFVFVAHGARAARHIDTPV